MKGLAKDQIISYNEIGRQLGISGEAVRDTEKRALRRMRRKLESMGLTLADILPTGASDYVPRGILNQLPTVFVGEYEEI